MDKMKSLEGELTFTDCYQRASVAEINGIKILFLNINHFGRYKKQLIEQKTNLMFSILKK